MRYFAQGKRRLSAFTLPMRLSITFFVVFVLLGLASSVALYHQQFAFDAGQAATYYRGNADDLEAETFYVAKSHRQLLETTHFHLFIMPVVYLALAHLYFLADRSEVEKAIVAAATFAALLAEVALPWLVRFHTPAWSSGFWVSGLGITFGTLWMSGFTLWEMWFGGRGG